MAGTYIRDGEPIQAVYTLGQIAALAQATGDAMMEVACNRCARRGRLSLARLLAEHGPSKGGPTLIRHLGGDCPKVGSQVTYDQCSIHAPQMPRWVAIPEP